MATPATFNKRKLPHSASWATSKSSSGDSLQYLIDKATNAEGTAVEPATVLIDRITPYPTNGKLRVPKGVVFEQVHDGVIDFTGSATAELVFEGVGIRDADKIDKPLFLNAPVNAFTDSSMAAGEAGAKGVKFDDDGGNAPLPERISTRLFGFTDATKNASVSERINRCDKAFIGKKATIEVYPGTIDDYCLSEEKRDYEWNPGAYPNIFNKALLDTEGHATPSKRAYITAPFATNSNVKHIAKKGVILKQSASGDKGGMFEPRFIHEIYENIEVSGFRFESQGSVDSAGAKSIILSGNVSKGYFNKNEFINGTSAPGYYCVTIMGGQNIDTDYFPEDTEANDNYVFNCTAQAFSAIRGRRQYFERNIVDYKWLAGMGFHGLAFNLEANAVRDLVEYIYFQHNTVNYDFSVGEVHVPVPFTVQGVGSKTRDIHVNFNTVNTINSDPAMRFAYAGSNVFLNAWGIDGLYLLGNKWNTSYQWAYQIRNCNRVTADNTIFDVGTIASIEGCSKSYFDFTKTTDAINNTVTETNSFFPVVAIEEQIFAIPIQGYDPDYRIQEHFENKTVNFNNANFAMGELTFNDIDNINYYRSAVSPEDFGAMAAVTFVPGDVSGNNVNITAHGLRHLEVALLTSDDVAPSLNNKELQLVWIIRHSANSFSFADSLTAAIAGTVQTISDAGEGTHTLTRFSISTHIVTALSTAANTLTLDAAHNYATGATVWHFNINGTAIGGLTDKKVYWVKAESATELKFATSEANLEAETYVDLTGSLTGTKMIVPALGTWFNDNKYAVDNDTVVNLSPHSASKISRPFGSTSTLELPAGTNSEIASGQAIGQMMADLQAQIKHFHPPVYLMDELSVAPYFLYSIRKPSELFTGACMRVFDGSTWHDIGYSGDWIDLAAINAIGFSNISRAEWYDVSGNNRHMTYNSGSQATLVANALGARPAMRYPSGNYMNLPANNGFTAGEVLRIFNAQAAGANGLWWTLGQDTSGDSYMPYSGDDKVYDSFLTTARKISTDTLTALGITNFVGNWHSYSARSGAGLWHSEMDDIVLRDTPTNTVGGHANPYLVQDREMREVFFCEFNSVLSAPDRTILMAERDKILGL